MTLREFFIGRAIVFCIVLVLGFGLVAYRLNVPHEPTLENTEPPVFTWTYEEDDTLNPDGFPQTNISLEARYPDGTVNRTFIDTTPSSCNDLPDADEDSVPNSTMIQCYGAGLGYRFKITKDGESYILQRQKFEEASHEYDPPSYAWEIVTTLPRR